MADAARGPKVATEPRLASLAAAYRDIERRYDELESLSREEHALLQAGAAVGDVRTILERKKAILEGIRTEEERVSEAKTWWSRVRRDLPPEQTQELLGILDAVAQRLERALALEADCRALLEQAAAFRAPGPQSPRAARLPAAAAYGRDTPRGAR